MGRPISAKNWGKSKVNEASLFSPLMSPLLHSSVAEIWSLNLKDPDHITSELTLLNTKNDKIVFETVIRYIFLVKIKLIRFTISIHLTH